MIAVLDLQYFDQAVELRDDDRHRWPQRHTKTTSSNTMLRCLCASASRQGV